MCYRQCPHEKPCPRFLIDNTPCNFQVGYHKILVRDAKVEKERYSYVVLKKGTIIFFLYPSFFLSFWIHHAGVKNSVEDEWPRIVRETLVRSKHSICRMCTANGKLEEVIFTASKHGKWVKNQEKLQFVLWSRVLFISRSMYQCARSTKWGDRLPVNISEPDVDK